MRGAPILALPVFFSNPAPHTTYTRKTSTHTQPNAPHGSGGSSWHMLQNSCNQMRLNRIVTQ